jgi:hypothetical protein
MIIARPAGAWNTMKTSRLTHVPDIQNKHWIATLLYDYFLTHMVELGIVAFTSDMLAQKCVE